MNYEAAVPNIVHYIRFGRDAKCFTSQQANGLLSVADNHAPFRVYIHTDNVASVQYNVDRLFAKRVQDLIEVRHYPQPNHIFGLNFSEVYRIRHAVDFTKLKLLRYNVSVNLALRKFYNTIVARILLGLLLMSQRREGAGGLDSETTKILSPVRFISSHASLRP